MTPTPAERRLIGLEIGVVLTVTLGLSAVRSGLSLLDALLAPAPLSSQQVTLNAPASTDALVDLAYQLVRVLQLVGWGALGAYLLLARRDHLRRVLPNIPDVDAVHDVPGCAPVRTRRGSRKCRAGGRGSRRPSRPRRLRRRSGRAGSRRC